MIYIYLVSVDALTKLHLTIDADVCNAWFVAEMPVVDVWGGGGGGIGRGSKQTAVVTHPILMQ